MRNLLLILATIAAIGVGLWYFALISTFAMIVWMILVFGALNIYLKVRNGAVEDKGSSNAATDQEGLTDIKHVHTKNEMLNRRTNNDG